MATGHKTKATVVKVKTKAKATVPTDRAKVFMSGRSQAVRIPLAYRFDVDEVEIRRDPTTGDVILSQPRKKQQTSWAQFFAELDAIGVPDDFLRDREQGPSQERDTL